LKIREKFLKIPAKSVEIWAKSVKTFAKSCVCFHFTKVAPKTNVQTFFLFLEVIFLFNSFRADQEKFGQLRVTFGQKCWFEVLWIEKMRRR